MSTDNTVNGRRVIVVGGGHGGLQDYLEPLKRNHGVDPRRVNPLAQDTIYDRKPSTEQQIKTEAAAVAKRNRRAAKAAALAAKSKHQKGK
jgi:hypothetical protein